MFLTQNSENVSIRILFPKTYLSTQKSYPRVFTCEKNENQAKA